MSKSEYYVLINDAEQGPYSLTDLGLLLQEGQIGDESYFCQPGMSEWLRIVEIRDLIEGSKPVSAAGKGEVSVTIPLPVQHGEVWVQAISEGLSESGISVKNQIVPNNPMPAKETSDNFASTQQRIVQALCKAMLCSGNDPAPTDLLSKASYLILGIMEGRASEADVRCEIGRVLQQHGHLPNMKDSASDSARLDLLIDDAVGLAQGYRSWKQGIDENVLDCWPAQELFAAIQKPEPRNWQSHWIAAGGRLLGKRMIALKNDPIWTKISAFGLPFAPFDLGSGMEIQDIDREEAEGFGLISSSDRINVTAEPFLIGLEEKTRDAVERYFSPSRQSELLESQIAQGGCFELLEIAREKLDSIDDLSEANTHSIVKMLWQAIETAPTFALLCEGYDLLIEILEGSEKQDELTNCRQRQYRDVKTEIEKGIPIEYNQRANAYETLAGICEAIGKNEEAIGYRQRQLEWRDGFSLLNEATEQLKAMAGHIEPQAAESILKMLNTALQRLPEKYSDRHSVAHRAIGEVYDALGDKVQAIQSYEQALKLNSKVGIKKRLDALRKQKPERRE